MVDRREPRDDPARGIAERIGSTQTAERLEEVTAVVFVHRVELDAEAASAIAGPPTVDDARDVTERVDVAIRARRLEAHDDFFAREHADVLRGLHEHAALRQIEREVSDDAEVVLAHHLAVDADVATKCAARIHAFNVKRGVAIGPIFSDP